MKKIIKLSMIASVAVFAAFMLPTSCKKKSSSTTCECHYRPTGATADSTFDLTLPAGYTASMATYCTSYDATVKSVYGSTAGCSMK